MSGDIDEVCWDAKGDIVLCQVNKHVLRYYRVVDTV